MVLSPNVKRMPGDDTWNIVGDVKGTVYRTSIAELIAKQLEPTLFKVTSYNAIYTIRRLYRNRDGEFFIVRQWIEATRNKGRRNKENVEIIEYVIEPINLERAISFYRYFSPVVPYENVFPSHYEIYRKYIKIFEIMEVLDLSEEETRKLLIEAGAKIILKDNDPNESVHSMFVSIVNNKFIGSSKGLELAKLMKRTHE